MPSKLLFALLVLVTVSFIASTVLAVANPQTSTMSVSADVYGSKPLVYDFSPTTGQNDGTTAITAIVGRNFTGATIVTLDDSSSTALTGTITVSTSCDNTASSATCGTGTYDKITGLTVPTGVGAGSYNVLVTTSSGTSILSDVLFTVTAPSAGTDTAVSSVSPNPISVQASSTATVTISVTDSDSATTYYEVAENGGTWDATSGSISMSSEAGSTSLTFTAGSTASTYTNTFSVDDTNSPFVGDDTESVLFYVQPAW